MKCDYLIIKWICLQNCEQSDGEPDSEAEKMSPLLDASTSTDPIAPSSPRGDKLSPLPPSPPHPGSLLAQVPAPTAADDSDYYTPDDQGPGGLLDADKVHYFLLLQHSGIKIIFFFLIIPTLKKHSNVDFFFL
jgi:hypothetical protein